MHSVNSPILRDSFFEEQRNEGCQCGWIQQHTQVLQRKEQDSHTSSVRQTNRSLLMKHGWNNTRAQRKRWAQAIMQSTFSVVVQLL